MRVAVTGASGNVGSALTRRLVAEPAIEEVVAVARRLGSDGTSNVSWVSADVRDEPAMVAAFDGVDAVVHLAWAIQPARDRALTRSINVDGSRAVFRAAERAGVGSVVHASSVGAYGPAADDEPVDEQFPATGLPRSFYSRDKAEVEGLLDALAAKGSTRVVRLRPGLIFQRSAAAEIRRLFAGPLLPDVLLRPGLLPLLPGVAGVRFQAVHADDVANAYHLVLTTPTVSGAFNIATDDVLNLRTVADILRTRSPLELPFGLTRTAADVAWRARLTPTPAGWLDLAAQAPIMSSQRARNELGWTPTHTGKATLAELLDGMRHGDGGATPPLERGAGGPFRLREFTSGLGARLGGRRVA